MVCQPALKEAFKPLVYPLIQVIDSVVNLIPTARYYPMRFHCVDMYIQIISATDMYIPVAPLLLDVIEVRALGADDLVEREVHGEAVEHIEARAVQDVVVTKAIALLTDYLRLLEKNVAYPELAYPIARSLKSYSKKCRVSQWSSATRALSQKLDKQSESIVRIRESISGAPMDLKNPNVK